MNSYQDIALDIVKDLNTRLLNQSFIKLQENDEEILPVNNYMPNIWENKWYNTQMAGYSKGYVVWKNVISEDDFLNQFGDLVYAYAQENTRLQPYLISSWSEVKAIKDSDVRQYWKTRYNNVISGYSEETLSPDGIKVHRQIFEPLFDYGPFDTKRPIEFYISTIDDNKELLSNHIAWKNAVISDDATFNSYVQTEFQLMFDKHLADYHLGGLSTYADVNDNFLAKNLSNFNQDEVFNCLRMISHDSYVNSYGFDYVTRFHKDEFDVVWEGKTYKCYKMFRLWNSGYLEHYGVVPCYPTSSTEVSAQFISVNLDWTYVDEDSVVSAPAYDYAQTSSFYGNRFAKLNYSTGKTETLLNFDGVEKYSRYSVTVTPMLFRTSDYDSDGKFVGSIGNLSAISYPVDCLDNSASSFVTTEVHHLKNNSFCFTKSNTDDLTQANIIQFYSYFTSGYIIL